MPIELKAYELIPPGDWTITPAGAKRDWMDGTPHKSAYRCLPLVMANQAGWVVGAPAAFKAVWKGGADPADTTITFQDTKAAERYSRGVVSIFGAGIVSFSLPWLFRTTERYGLLVRGPSNLPLQNIAPLEGLVETDWAPYTFTMNWKLTKRNTEVWFKKGDPVCMLTPFPIDLLEDTSVSFADLADDPILAEDFAEWKKNRMRQYQDLDKGEVNWKLDYMRGRKPGGERAPAHRSNLKLARFDGG